MSDILYESQRIVATNTNEKTHKKLDLFLKSETNQVLQINRHLDQQKHHHRKILEVPYLTLNRYVK